MRILRLSTLLALVGLRLAVGCAAAQEEMLRAPSMPESDLLHKVDPKYPPEALRRQIQGTVRFEVIIGKDGRIQRLRLVSGHPLLVEAARQAVQHWVYRPTLLRGKPVRVVTEIDVQFRLDAHGNPVMEKAPRKGTLSAGRKAPVNSAGLT